MPKETGLRNSIIGGVFSTLIAAAIVYFVPSVWGGLKYSLSAIWFGITYPVPIPVWVMIILISLILPTLFAVTSKLAHDLTPSWRDYTRDRFKGMIWRWRYSSTVGGYHNVWCHCPEDRVMFAGDWPVCLMRASFEQWVNELKEIVKDRSATAQRKLFHDNAKSFYGLGDTKAIAT